MRKIVLPIIVCLFLLGGCATPAVVQPLPPEPEVIVPAEKEPILVWEPIVEESVVEEPVVEEPVIEEESSVPKHLRRVPKVAIDDRALEVPAVDERSYSSFLTHHSYSEAYRYYMLLNMAHFPEGQFVWEDTRRRDQSDLRNPTYQDLLDFLAEDKTNEIPYVEYVMGELPPKADGSTSGSYIVEGFVCQDFAVTLQENANKQRLRCAVLFIHWEPGDRAHALNAFETPDKGLIWVSSQGSSLEGRIGSDQLYEPCRTQEDLCPVPWGEKSNPPPPAHPLTRVIYIW